MYPLDIPGITGESMERFRFNDNANEKTRMQLISKIPPDLLVVFYDRDYPSPSDPGAFVAFKRINDQYSIQQSNHGWSSKWKAVTVESLVQYLSKCAKYNMGPESPNMMFAQFEIVTPAQVENDIQRREKEISLAYETGDHYKEAEERAHLGDILMLKQGERALEHYAKAIVLYHELSNREKEARILGNMAIIYSKLKQFEKAIEVKQRQVHIFEEIGYFLLTYEQKVLARYQKAATKKWWQFWK